VNPSGVGTGYASLTACLGGTFFGRAERLLGLTAATPTDYISLLQLL